MSSVTLSPRHHPSMPVDDTVDTRGVMSSINGHGRRSLRSLGGSKQQSPVATDISAGVSGRTRSRASNSPDKTVAEKRKLAPAEGQSHTVAVDISNHDTGRNDTRQPELDKQSDSSDYDSEDSSYQYPLRRSIARPIPDPVPQPAPLATKLRFSFPGMKRKTEEMTTNGSVSALFDLGMDTPASAPSSPVMPTTELDGKPDIKEKGTEDVNDDESVIGEAVPKGTDKDYKSSSSSTKNIPQRAPRKKRKWLKRGEVDPDDPAAVARQKERHKLIDLALADLDAQYEAVLSNSHESIAELFDELSNRKAQQERWLKERHEAAIAELGRMRDQTVKQVKCEFLDRREELVDQMNVEDLHKKSRLRYENILHCFITDTYPATRDGRGGGGWQYYPSDALSKRTEKLVPSGVDYSGVRRDISLLPQSLDPAIGQADYKRMLAHSADGSARIDRHGSSSSARARSSHSSRSHRKRESSPYRNPPVHPYIKQIENSKPSPPVKPAAAVYRPVPHPSMAGSQPAQPSAPKKPSRPYASSKPLYYDAVRHDPDYLTWEDYRALARYDAWGCPLPHDRHRRDLVLQESWEKTLGRIRRDTLAHPSVLLKAG